MRLLVANEPRSYRDAVAAFIRVLRPAVEVIVAEPDHLDDAVGRYTPDLVLCSRVTESLLDRAPSWVVLYPNGARLAVACIYGLQRTSHDLNTVHLLGLVDETIEHAALHVG